MKEAILKIENLSKHFGSLKAVDNVSFEMYEGEILGLIGPNGAGKTTMYNSINGIYKPTNGTVWWKGEDITGLKPHEVCNKGISRSFQVVKPFEEMTVFENVLVTCLYGGEGDSRDEEERAENALKEMKLWDHKDKMASSLTIPDLKRLEMARARAQNPDLLLLDEVVAGLNPTEMAGALDLVEQIRDYGIPIFIVEHEMHAIKRVCDRVLVLEAGELIAEGTPEEIGKDKKVIKAYLGERYAEVLA